MYICTCIALREVLTSLFQESQGLTTYAFVMLLHVLAMISLHMLTFRLMVTMAADFCSLVTLIHNTLQGEITISSTKTTRVKYYTSLPQFVTTHFHTQIQVHLFYGYALSRRMNAIKCRSVCACMADVMTSLTSLVSHVLYDACFYISTMYVLSM